MLLRMAGHVVQGQLVHIQKHMLFVVLLQQHEPMKSEKVPQVLAPKLSVSHEKSVQVADVKI